MFLGRFLLLFEEKKTRGAMPKSTFPFSHTDPQKTHFFEKKFFGRFFDIFEKSKFSKIENLKSGVGCLG
jgi:hypothetical protein